MFAHRLARGLFTALLLQVSLAAAQNAGVEERRVALVIGNNAYRNVEKLRTAVSDAQAMAREFRELGFEVIEKHNVDQRTFKAAVRELVQRVAHGGVGAFFFAGHGVQEGGNNYLLPVDVEALKDSSAIADEAVELNGEIMMRVGQSGARFSLLVIDACRDNPFPRRAGRSIGGARGLVSAPVTPEGMIVVYSAGVGQQALDRLGEDDRNPNGLFTRELIREIRRPGLEVADIVRNVRGRVKALAASVKHEQTPAIYIQADRFYLTSRPSRPVSAKAADPDTEAWAAANEVDSTSAYRSYLAAYSKGRYAVAARIKLEALTETQPDPGRPVAAAPSPAPKPAAPDGEDTLWQRASVSAEVALATAYLELYPQGRHAPAARERVRQLSDPVLRYPAGSVLRDCAECLELLVIPAGAFEMGSAVRGNEESPVHRVRFTRPFAMARTEVTQAQWLATMGSLPPQTAKCADCAVEGVSWEDARDFLARYSRRTGQPYRLPSEAEWEYACRAGTQTPYCGGEQPDAIAWHHLNSGHQPQAVARKQPNPWGLFDLSGNVWEWVADCWNRNYEEAPSDGGAWLSGSCDTRVLRGGSWANLSDSLRATARERDESTSGKSSYGFRPVRELP